MCKVFICTFHIYTDGHSVASFVHYKLKCPYLICSKVSILIFVSTSLNYVIQQHFEYDFGCLLVREALFIRVFHCPVLKRMQLTPAERVESLYTRDDGREEATCRSLTLLFLVY